MAFLFHHSLCRRYRTGDCRLEDLDLDAAFLRHRHSGCIFYVPRGKIAPNPVMCS